jgi:dephospho-CoA kinase
MVVLGITGGIGSGKSFISSLLREKMNVPVYDCDAEAKRLICDDEEVRQELTELVGTDIYKDGKLQKQKLADFLFASQQNAQMVNAIVHPAVKKDFCQWVRRQHAEVVAMESAILYESGFDTTVDKVLYVDAPLELRIQRTMHRDGSTRQQVEARINMQQSEAQRGKADYVIENDDARQEVLLASLQEIFKIIN